MKVLHFIAITAFSLLVGVSSIHACEPCSSTLNLEQTIEKSDLIIVGQRTDFSPDEKNSPENLPDSINVKIIETIKGKIKQDQITINSWDGMCGYGVVIDDKIYKLFLQEKDGIYDAVDSGCSVKAVLVANNLEDFNKREAAIETESDSPAASKPLNTRDAKSNLIYFIGIGAIILLVLLLIIKKLLHTAKK